MKKVITVVMMLFVFSLQSFAETDFRTGVEIYGGVDVGNGGRVTAGMIEGFFKTEDRLVYKIKNTLNQVRSGQHERVQRWIQQGQCQVAMEYDSTDVIVSYRMINDEWVRGVIGYTKILLDKCRDPYAIEADDRPGDEADAFLGDD